MVGNRLSAERGKIHYNMSPPPPCDREHFKAVDKRASGLTALHLKKAKDVDRYFGGVGQMQRKLEGYWEVRGWYSERLVRLMRGYYLVQTLAASKLSAVAGWPH